MATAARLPIAAWRNELCVRTIRFVGIDLTGVDMRMQVRLRPDAPGAPLIDLDTVTTLSSQGLKLDNVSTEGGVPVSTVKLRINETTMADPAMVPYGGEPGTDTALSYAIQLGGATRVVGQFIALATVIDSEGAPTGSVSGYGSASGMLPWSAAQVTFSDDDITISIDGTDLLAPLVTSAAESASTATAAVATLAPITADLALGGASKLSAIGADLLSGSSSIALVAANMAGILAAPAAATDAQTARVGAEVAQAGAIATRDGIITTLGAANEVVATEAGGTNYSVDYSAAADGTAGNAVGTPPLTASGVAFSTVGGYAVSGAGTATATPAFLFATPNYASSKQTTVITPASGQAASVAQNIGPLMYYTDTANFAFWGVNKDTGQVYFRRVQAGNLTSAITFASGAGAMTSWTLETTSVGKRTFNATLIRPDGTRYGPYTYNASSDFTPAWGIAAVGASLRARSVIVNTNRSQVARRIGDAEAAIVANATKADPSFSRRILGDREAKWPTFPARGDVIDIKGSATEYVLIDNFTGADGTLIAAHTPDYDAPNLPTGYTTWGSMPWQILGNALTALGPVTSAQRAPGLLVAAIGRRLSKTWLATAKGVEISGELSSLTALTGVGGIFFKTAGSTAGAGPGGFLVEISQSKIRLLYRSESGVGSKTLVDGWPKAGTFPTNARFSVRMYEGNGMIAKVGDTDIAWGFFSEEGRDYPPITHAGVFVDPDQNITNFRFDNIKIGPVPAQGSSRYRALAALPPAVAPKSISKSVVMDIVTADTGAGIYNFAPINMAKVAAITGISIIDNYYFYGSTNHAVGTETAAGGIFLFTAPTLEGPFTRYGVAGINGRIFIDTDGNQTETPVVDFNEETGMIDMIYQNVKIAGENRQESRSASSANGIDGWVKNGTLFPAWNNTPLASTHARHTGYFSKTPDPLGVNPGWYGYHRLAPGTTGSLTAMSRSMDGKNWETDLLPFYYPFLQALFADTRVIHNHGYATKMFAYQGQRLMFVAPFRTNPSAGPSTGYIAVVRVADDMRNMSGQEVIPYPMTEADELIGSQTISGVIEENGILYLYVQSNQDKIRVIRFDLTKGPDGLARHLGV